MTIIFQASLSFRVLFILGYRQSVVMSGICVIAYGSLVVGFDRHHGMLLPELVLLCLGASMNVAAKRILALSQKALFQERMQKLEREKDLEEQVLQEKLLRCEAEFKIDSFESMTHLSCEDDESDTTSSCVHRLGGVLRTWRSGHSVRSAPPEPLSPLLRSGGDDSGAQGDDDECTCRQGDCLAADAVVWIEGQSVPQALGTVTVGQKILCLDNLTGQMKHVPVISSSVSESDAAEWITVSLQDGTVLEMTGNHPVEPYMNGRRLGAVWARNLKTESHSLMVLKMETVPVCTVQEGMVARYSQEGRQQQQLSKAAVTVHQPERHMIFVARRDHTTQIMAVGSASLKPAEALNGDGLVVRNTFYDIIDGTEVWKRSAARRSSAPPRLNLSRQSDDIRQSPAHSQKNLEDLRKPRTPESPRQPALSSCSSARSMPSGASSDGEVMLNVGPPAPLKLCWDGLNGINGDASASSSLGLQPPRTAASSSRSLALSDLLRVRRAGLPSYGSAGHQDGSCKPCKFGSLNLSKPGFKPCFKGALCDRCHEPGHENAYRRAGPRGRPSSPGRNAGSRWPPRKRQGW
eukprot:CAMPEP_0170576414 /NCGR_PEP_ID=MMETSP0224-20130122/4378_1 /TAXON_ID=285029 /ORGANISM="Togula jolla, Strain CCCM 725" /LENGTH=576 /DNA_ID=CAMNT_0010899251 /DNA_START=351 /DNA_END=2081 /DNA_ORIENTATION=-